MKIKNIRIAVTGLNATDNPGPGVPVIRAIRDSEEFCGEIVGFTYDQLDPGIYMENICDHAYLIPYPSEGSTVLLKRIKAIHSKTPLDVIIPTLDSELSIFIQIEKELEKLGIKTFLPTKQMLDLRSKAQLAELRKKYDILVPRGMAITNPALLYQVQEEFNYPLMIKGQFYEAYIAYNAAEAEQYFKKISYKWGLPVIIQEFITGDEYDVVALGDGTGELIGAVPMKKMQLTDKGKAWGGMTIMDPKMNEYIKDLMSKIKWRGPCEFEIMKSNDDGKFYLIEVNPRFPAWCYLAVGAGQNLQWAVVKLALGEEVKPFDSYNVGTMFIRNSIDQVYSISDYQEMTMVGELHKKK